MIKEIKKGDRSAKFLDEKYFVKDNEGNPIKWLGNSTFQNYSKEYLDNAQELQAVCDAQSSQHGYTKAEQQFEEVVTETLNQCQDTMLIKGREYRRNNNPFHNFDKGVEISGKTREEVIWGFALKHFISIQDIRSDLREGKLPSEELLNEKYGDMINYLLIEKASIVAKIKAEQ